MGNIRRSNSDRTAAMRARLLGAARDLFARKGYADTSTPEIVAAAQVTRGALYHHFPDKKAIFCAVLEAEAADVAEEIEASDAPGMDAAGRLFAGAAAYVHAMQAEGRVRLLLIDGPAVLGRSLLASIEQRHGEASLRLGLQEVLSENGLSVLQVDVLAALVSAMLERAALEVSGGVPVGEVLAATELLLGSMSSKR
jgi:AcrR family transcriptional regulator